MSDSSDNDEVINYNKTNTDDLNNTEIIEMDFEIYLPQSNDYF